MTAHVRNLLLCEPTPITYFVSPELLQQGGFGSASRCIGMWECAQVQDKPLWHQLLPLRSHLCGSDVHTRCI